MGELTESLIELRTCPIEDLPHLAKNLFLMGELAELHKSSELCPERFTKNIEQNYMGELAELDRAQNLAPSMICHTYQKIHF